jgi:hypothetical protein
MCTRTGLTIQRHAEIGVLRTSNGPLLFGVVKGCRTRSQAMGGSYCEVVEGGTVRLSSGRAAKTNWFGEFIFNGLELAEPAVIVEAIGWDFGGPRTIVRSGTCSTVEIQGRERPARVLVPELPQLK